MATSRRMLGGMPFSISTTRVSAASSAAIAAALAAAALAAAALEAASAELAEGLSPDVGSLLASFLGGRRGADFLGIGALAVATTEPTTPAADCRVRSAEPL